MSYNEILNSVKSDILNLIDTLTCLADEPEPETPEGNTISEYESGSRAQTVLYEIIKKSEILDDTIKLSCLTLFDDLEHNQKNTNFLTLYGFADSFSTYGKFNKETLAVDVDYTFTKIRGYLYASLAGIEKGEYLKIIESTKKEIEDICYKYEEMYIEFEPEKPELPEEPMIPKIIQFWDLYISDFTNEITPLGTNFDNINTDFVSFKNYILSYKELGINGSSILALGGNFINESQSIGCEKDFSMTGVHNLSGKYYKNYNDDIGYAFSTWQSVKEFSDTLTNKKDYEIFNIKVNYYNSLLLEKINFFLTSKNIFDNINMFIRKYNLI